jgi:protein-S-isoprenylcysteine O-methyltransferase Ste14
MRPENVPGRGDGASFPETGISAKLTIAPAMSNVAIREASPARRFMPDQAPAIQKRTWIEKPLIKALCIGLGTIINLGLPILAMGGVGPFFSQPARVALAIAFVVICIVALFAGGNISPGVREDRGNRWVLTAFFALGLANMFVPAYAERKDFWVIDGDAVRWLGVVLFTIFGLLRLWPVFVLGNRFSGLVAIQPGHTLVTTGVYRYIRHPSYLGLLGNFLGWSLAFRSGVGIVICLFMLVPLIARMNAEERLLRSEFGEEYEVFCARTSRLIPGIY